MEIIVSSPDAQKLIKDRKENESMPHCSEPDKTGYPVSFLSVGKSITWPLDEKKYNAVRQFAFQWNKKNAENGKRLKAIRHRQYNLIELARIA